MACPTLQSSFIEYVTDTKISVVDIAVFFRHKTLVFKQPSRISNLSSKTAVLNIKLSVSCDVRAVGSVCALQCHLDYQISDIEAEFQIPSSPS